MAKLLENIRQFDLSSVALDAESLAAHDFVKA